MKKRCLVCGSSDTKIIYRKGIYSIFQCQKCQFGFLNPYPKDNFLKKIYQKNYFYDKKKSFYLSDAKYKFEKIKKYLKTKGKILDFGCGLGDFIGILKKNGYFPYGYDISKYAVDYVRKKFKIEAISSRLSINLYPENSFNNISCFDVVEHIKNFNYVIKCFNHWLKKNGYLFLTTPNINSLEKKIMGSYWYGFKKIPEHINYFSHQSIKVLLKENNFKIIEIKAFGFVRSLSFFLKKIKLINNQKKNSLLDKIHIYLPLTDMLVIAEKK